MLTSLGLGPFTPETTGTETRSDCSSGVMGIGDTQRFRCPFVNKLVDLLLDGIQYICGRTLARTNLFRKMNEVFLSVGRSGAGLKKGANDEKCQQKFEDRAAWGVLMRRLYVACDNIRPWYLIKKRDPVCKRRGESELERNVSKACILRQVEPSLHSASNRPSGRVRAKSCVLQNPTLPSFYNTDTTPESIPFLIGLELHISTVSESATS